MLLTEAEAKTKECRSAAAPGGVLWVKQANGEFAATFPRCVASGCMMWRLGDPLIEEVPRLPGSDSPPGDGWKSASKTDRTSLISAPVWRRISAQRGFCGLAGQP